VPVGNPAPDLYDNLRPGDNLYTCSMVALDVNTGKLNCTSRPSRMIPTIGTSPSEPSLYDQSQGVQRELIAVAGKDGLLRVLDRVSHAPALFGPFHPAREC